MSRPYFQKEAFRGRPGSKLFPLALHPWVWKMILTQFFFRVQQSRQEGRAEILGAQKIFLAFWEDLYIIILLSAPVLNRG